MPRFVFDSYAGSAAALSFVAHLAIAIAVVWCGAGLFDNGAGEGRPAITWVPLPEIISQQGETLAAPIPTVTVPTVAPPGLEPLNLKALRPVATIALPIPSPGPLRASSPAPAPGPVGIDKEVSGERGRGPSCGDGRDVGASPGADAGPGSGGSARDVFGPTPVLVPTTTAPAPPDDKREHDVQFWIRADGRVTKIAVSPPIRDSDYRRRFREAMSTFVFGPVRMPDGHPIDYVYSCVVYP